MSKKSFCTQPLSLQILPILVKKKKKKKKIVYLCTSGNVARFNAVIYAHDKTTK